MMQGRAKEEFREEEIEKFDLKETQTRNRLSRNVAETLTTSITAHKESKKADYIVTTEDTNVLLSIGIVTGYKYSCGEEEA